MAICILEISFGQLNEEEKSYTYFQQGNVPVHTKENSMQALLNRFTDSTRRRKL
jgi:hypothetical protein